MEKERKQKSRIKRERVERLGDQGRKVVKSEGEMEGIKC